MKYFIITVDTEGDNLWDWVPGAPINTENSKYLERFQLLCNKYGFKPVYLSNFEMLGSDDFVSFAKKYLELELCEIGLHLHAWNTPPLIDIERKYDQPSYLIEYPVDVMRAKFETLYNLYVEKLGTKPVSHRSGRWTMNDEYFKILKEYDIKVDCSVTPHINWSKNVGAYRGGSDYSNSQEKESFINEVYELPMTIRKIRWSTCGSWKHMIKAIFFGSYVWLRPASTHLGDMIRILRNESKSENGYVEFMVHSSELMPGGSPYYPDENSIEKLYQEMELLFGKANDLGYHGITMADYYAIKSK